MGVGPVEPTRSRGAEQSKPPFESIKDFQELKTQIDQLEELQGVLKTLNKRSLQKSKQTAQTKAAAATTPQKTQAAGSGSNQYEPYMKTEVSYLIQLIDILLKANPNDPTLQKYKQELLNMQSSKPPYSSQQVQQLNEIFLYALKEGKNPDLPENLGKEFSKTELEMLKEMIGQNKNLIGQYKNEIAAIQKKINFENEYIKKLEDMKRIFENFQSISGFTAEDFGGLLSDFKWFNDNQSQLSPQEAQAVKGFFSKLAAIKNNQGETFAQAFAHIYLSQWISQIKNPQTAAQLKEFLEGMLKQSGYANSDNPFFKQIGDTIQQYLDSPNFPNEKIDGATPFKQEDGKYVADQNIYEDVYSHFVEYFQLSQGVSVKDVLNALDTSINNMNAVVKKNQADITALNQSINYLNSLDSSLQTSHNKVKDASHYYGSLPDQFKHAIFGYMKGQEAYLEQLSFMLYYFNFGAQMDNKLLTGMTDFTQASQYYDFTNSLDKSGNVGAFSEYKGDPSKEQQKLKDEKTQVGNDLKSTNNAINEIDQKIKDINADKSLTRTQKKNLIKQLKGYRAKLVTAKGNLTKLQNSLNAIQIVPIGSDSFLIEDKNGNPPPAGWEDAMHSEESSLTSGPDSLDQIYRGISGDQSEYSSQSQIQQMRTQLAMTEIQQEWTVVSTSMQLLNQMYMTVAQGISK